MKVRITKCSNIVYWYADRIGYEFEIRDTGEQVYYVEYKGVERGVDKEDCEVIPYEPVLIAEQPNDKLFQAAVAAMQGLLSNSILAGVMKTFNGLPHKDEIAEAAFTYAEALINEGKKRGHL